MSVPPALVVDASVAAKWHLTDESHIELASALKERFDAGLTILAAPAFIRLEMAQMLQQAERSARLPVGTASEEFERFLGFGIHEPMDTDELVLAAQHLARATGATVYDALYIATAEALTYDVVTLDEELVRQMADHPVTMHLLSELDLS